MPTPPRGPRLGGSPAHEKLIMRNLAQSLFEHGRITTTLTKAKRLRPYAEKLLTTAKRGDLHARREVLKVIRDKDVVHRLFADIAPTFVARNGGYTRIIKTAPRKGDNAPMAIIELVAEETVTTEANRQTRRAARVRSSAGSSPAADVATGTVPANQDEVSAVSEQPSDSSEQIAESAEELPSQAGAASSEDNAEGADDAVADDGAPAEQVVSDEPAEGRTIS